MGKLQLTTEIDKKSGFCFGVISAIDKAENTLDSNINLYCLGEIVHNDEEIKRLEQKGLTIISKAELKTGAGASILCFPKSLKKLIFKKTSELVVNAYDDDEGKEYLTKDNVKDIPKDELLMLIKDLEEEMKKASLKLDFETAAKIRDKIQI